MVFETWYKQTLAAKLNPWDVSMIVDVAPSITAWRVYLKSGSQEEWISFSGVSGTTLTGLQRQLSKTSSPSVSQGDWYTWIAWTPVRIVAMHDQIADLQDVFNNGHTYNGNNTFNGEQTVEGKYIVNWEFEVDEEWKFVINGESIPYPVVADTTERDSLYTNPQGWEMVYVQSLNAVQVYNGWNNQWESFGISTPVGQASTSSYGTVKLATDSDAESNTGVWVIQAVQGPVMYWNMAFKEVSWDFSINWNELCYGITPDNDFVVSAWNNLKVWAEYVVRVYSQWTIYNMSLWNWVSNPFGDNIIFKANKDTTMVFFATSNSTLELWTIRTAL